jgi:hypothetical protein
MNARTGSAPYDCAGRLDAKPVPEAVEPPIAMVAAAQQAILAHPFFKGGAVHAFGIANAAVKAALAARVLP